jgi:hypothetical protein
MSKKKYYSCDDLMELMHLLEEWISEYHNMVSEQAERHVFILYRNKVLEICDKCGGAN